MGSYNAASPHEAIIKMAKSGNLSGYDWTAEYHAFPEGSNFTKFRINSAQFQQLDEE